MSSRTLTLLAIVLAAPLGACSNDDQVKQLQEQVDQLRAQIATMQGTPGPKGDVGPTGPKGDKGDHGPAAMLVGGANRELIGVHTEGGCALVDKLGEVCYGQGLPPLAYYESTDCTGPWYELPGIRSKLPRSDSMWVAPDGTVLKYDGPAIKITSNSQRSGSGECDTSMGQFPVTARPVVDAGKKMTVFKLDQLAVELH